jgi:hypothetical protein
VVPGPRRSRTSRLPAPPDPLEPPHPHRAGEAVRVVQHLDTATVAVRVPGPVDVRPGPDEWAATDFGLRVLIRPAVANPNSLLTWSVWRS